MHYCSYSHQHNDTTLSMQSMGNVDAKERSMSRKFETRNHSVAGIKLQMDPNITALPWAANIHEGSTPMSAKQKG